MKESIDLTENRAFYGNGKKSPKRYPHKNLPWLHAGDFESAKLRKKDDTLFAKTYFSDNQTVTWRYLLEDNYSFQISSNNISFNTTDNNFYSNSLYNSHNSTTYMITSDNNIDWLSLENIKEVHPEIFPTGKRDDIKLNRLKETSKYINYRKDFCLCSKCGKKIYNTPWDRKYYGIRICEEDCKSVILKNELRWKLSENYSFYRFNDDDVYSDIPCISKRIPKMKQERKYPKRYNCLKTDWARPYSVKRFKQENRKVYYKGFNNRSRFRFSDLPWQPKGRVRQVYDDIFEDMSWRDLLRQRLEERTTNGKK